MTNDQTDENRQKKLVDRNMLARPPSVIFLSTIFLSLFRPSVMAEVGEASGRLTSQTDCLYFVDDCVYERIDECPPSLCICHGCRVACALKVLWEREPCSAREITESLYSKVSSSDIGTVADHCCRAVGSQGLRST